jgi:hypothetical protein
MAQIASEMFLTVASGVGVRPVRGRQWLDPFRRRLARSLLGQPPLALDALRQVGVAQATP